ncbi:MAG: beta-ketoacyl-ACP synthase [Cyanobacteria bacterium J06631_9]
MTAANHDVANHDVANHDVANHDVVVTGLAMATALGDTAAENWTRLMAGESAIALRQPFLDLAPGPLAMMGKEPAALQPMTVDLARQAWEDAGLNLGLEASLGFGERCGVVVGSSRSHLQTLEEMSQQQRQMPGQVEGNWLGALAHGPAIAVAKTVNAQGPLLAPMAACATGVWAIAQAAELIQSGVCDRVVAGAVEAPITPMTIAGFRKMGALAKTGCYPFDIAREGFVLGEGGALMVLESAALASARSAKQIYGKVLGVGITNDSHHVSSFDPSYEMGQRAVALCLARSGLAAKDIDAVHTHGTSTLQNDQMEAALISHLQTLRGSAAMAVMATKGATGHTLGASGAVIVGCGLLSLHHQALLPCVGLKEAGFNLAFVREGRAAQLRNLLCFSFGFGGQNAVLALGR